MRPSLEVTDSPSGVRVLTLSNPSKRNALDRATLEALRAALRAPATVRAFLIRGAGEGVFCAGYDLNELAAYQSSEQPPDEHVADVLDGLTNSPLPSVALITGPAFGAGCELAMACDVRVGSEAARFCMPPVKLGLVYSRRGFSRIASRVGASAARFLFLTGRQVKGERALQLGLLDVLDAAAEAEAVSLAIELAQASPIAIEGTKALFEASPSAELISRYERLRSASFEAEALRERLASKTR